MINIFLDHSQIMSHKINSKVICSFKDRYSYRQVIFMTVRWVLRECEQLRLTACCPPGSQAADASLRWFKQTLNMADSLFETVPSLCMLLKVRYKIISLNLNFKRERFEKSSVCPNKTTTLHFIYILYYVTICTGIVVVSYCITPLQIVSHLLYIFLF